MATLNQCSFIGHVGKDPTMSDTPSQLRLTYMTVRLNVHTYKYEKLKDLLERF